MARGVRGSGKGYREKPSAPAVRVDVQPGPVSKNDDVREFAAECVAAGRAFLAQLGTVESVSEQGQLYRSAVTCAKQAAEIEGAAANLSEAKILRSPGWRHIEDQFRACCGDMCGPCVARMAAMLEGMGS